MNTNKRMSKCPGKTFNEVAARCEPSGGYSDQMMLAKSPELALGA